eukprot:TRINITY_DN8221_c0_g1_i1.p1 TRINITY_DN8221_c0_g1~~TRINITY_DN8221_c0_g1_i1.p1  ORF type:complete len:405 (+),score=56.70 TRINITY_DN8221_c0_g1_i1:32-1246(+)
MENSSVNFSMEDLPPFPIPHDPNQHQQQEDQDFVVKEMPVYLTQSMADNLLILQYPLRPRWKPYNQNNLTGVRIAPKESKIELEYRLERDENYNKEDNSGYDKFILTSTNIPLKTNYAVGVIRSNELHITPISPPNAGIYQFRPQFDYLDRSRKEGDTEKEEEKKDENESWMTYDYVPATRTGLSAAAYERLFCSGGFVTGFEMEKNEYLTLLNPPPPISGYSTHRIIPLYEIRKMPLQEQVQHIMQYAYVLQQQRLEELAVFSNLSELLICMSQVAVLVQGCWVLRPVFTCYKRKLLQTVYEFILLLFTKDRFVKREDVYNATGIDNKIIVDMLSKVAIPIKGINSPGWELKLPYDSYFDENFLDVVEQYREYWESSQERIFISVQSIFENTFPEEIIEKPVQ